MNISPSGTDEKGLIQGSSASGMFANRFTIVHPQWVKAATISSPGGRPLAPGASLSGEHLPSPVVIADTNDSLDYSDGWDEKAAHLVDRLFGHDPLARWAAARVQFFLTDGVAHDRRELQRSSTEFFRKVLHGE